MAGCDCNCVVVCGFCVLVVGSDCGFRLGLKLTAARAVLYRREHCVNLNRDARSRWNRDRNSDRRITAADLAATAVARITQQVDVGMQAVIARHDHAL